MSTQTPASVHIPSPRQPLEVFPVVMDKVKDSDSPLTDFRPRVVPADYDLDVPRDNPEDLEEKADPKAFSVPEPVDSSDSEEKIEPPKTDTPARAPAVKASTPPKAPSLGKRAS